MRVEYDRRACAGWFQCVQQWGAFDMNMPAGKADLANATETDDGMFVREVPTDAEDEAVAAAESCPVDAIQVYDDDGDLIELDDED